MRPFGQRNYTGIQPLQTYLTKDQFALYELI